MTDHVGHGTSELTKLLLKMLTSPLSTIYRIKLLQCEEHPFCLFLGTLSFSHGGSPEGKFLFGSSSDTEPAAPRLELLRRARQCPGRYSGHVVTPSCPVLAVKYWDQDLAYFYNEVEGASASWHFSVHLCDVQRYSEQFN